MSVRALDGSYRLYDFFIGKRRAAADPVPGEQKLHDDIWIDRMPKKVASERGYGRIAPPLLHAVTDKLAPIGNRMSSRASAGKSGLKPVKLDTAWQLVSKSHRRFCRGEFSRFHGFVTKK